MEQQRITRQSKFSVLSKPVNTSTATTSSEIKYEEPHTSSERHHTLSEEHHTLSQEHRTSSEEYTSSEEHTPSEEHIPSEEHTLSEEHHLPSFHVSCSSEYNTNKNVNNLETESLKKPLEQSLNENEANNVFKQSSSAIINDSCNQISQNYPSSEKILELTTLDDMTENVEKTGNDSNNTLQNFYPFVRENVEMAQENLSQRNSSIETTRMSIKEEEWRQVNFVKKLIPTFDGKEEDDVTNWLNKISIIAHQYKISDKIIMLAVILQLKGRALNWFNQQPLETVKEWINFKIEIQDYFKTTVSYTTIIHRIWKTHDEKFLDYAEEKLSLMQLLRLSNEDQIELLIDGVREPTLRMILLGTSFNHISHFLNYVRKITEDKIVSRYLSNNHSEIQ